LDHADKAEKLIRNLAQRLERDWSGVSGSILEGIRGNPHRYAAWIVEGRFSVLRRPLLGLRPNSAVVCGNRIWFLITNNGLTAVHQACLGANHRMPPFGR
jgi:hypothetical protein